MPGTTQEREHEIERILALTLRARERAQAGDWDATLAAETERRPLIRDLFAQSWPLESRLRVAGAIRQILSSDAGLIALAAAGRNDAADESSKLRRGRSAAVAYAATGVTRLPQGGKSVPPARGGPHEVVDLP